MPVRRFTGYICHGRGNFERKPEPDFRNPLADYLPFSIIRLSVGARSAVIKGLVVRPVTSRHVILFGPPFRPDRCSLILRY